MGIKRITTSFTDKSLMNGSAATVQALLESIESSFSACNGALQGADMSEVSYSFQAEEISEMTQGNTKLQTYAGSAHLQVEQELDRPLYLDFKDNATEIISQIILDDITTDNTFGMEEYYDVADGSCGFVSEIRVKKELKMRDFLDFPDKVEDIESTVLKNVETVGVFASLFRLDYESLIADGMDIEECVQAYMTSGEFNHQEYHPVRDVISGVLDVTVVKPLVESIIGYDIITLERLDGLERGLKLADATVGAFTLGQGAAALKAAGYVGKEAFVVFGKTVALDALSDLAAGTANRIGVELGIPAELNWLMTVATGSMVSVQAGKYIFADINSPGTKKTLKEFIESIKERFRKGGTGSAEEVIESGTDTVTYRRVQGGAGNQSSQQRVVIDSEGNVYINKKDRNLNISIDNGEHSQYYINNNRPGADIYEFEVPKWLDDMVKEYTIPQAGYKNNPLNQGGSAPKLTDPTTPGTCIEFPAPWIEWIEEYATNGRIISGGQ